MYRARLQPIRTFSELSFKIKIPSHQTKSVYQLFAPKIQELKVLGMSNKDIAIKLKINRKTVIKGLKIARVHRKIGTPKYVMLGLGFCTDFCL